MRKEFLSKENLENKEREPKISYRILYGSHGTAEDFKEFEGEFKKADIYIPEACGWTPETLEEFNQISQGKGLTLDEFVVKYNFRRGSSVYKELEVIKDSKKPILLVDASRDTDLTMKRIEATLFYMEAIKLFENGKFEPAINSMRKYVELMAKHVRKREDCMKRNLKEKVNNLIQKDKALRNKEEVKILLTLGSAHTKLFQDLKKEKLSISRQHASYPDVFLSTNEAIRMILLSSKKPSDELLVRAFIDSSELFLRYLRSLTKDTTKSDRMARKISSKLSFEDIKEISEELGRYKKANIISCLKDRGIKLPKSEKEMDEMLGIESKNKKS